MANVPVEVDRYVVCAAGKVAENPRRALVLGLFVALEGFRKVLELGHAGARAVFEPLVFPKVLVRTAHRVPFRTESGQQRL